MLKPFLIPILVEAFLLAMQSKQVCMARKSVNGGDKWYQSVFWRDTCKRLNKFESVNGLHHGGSAESETQKSRSTPTISSGSPKVLCVQEYEAASVLHIFRLF